MTSDSLHRWHYSHPITQLLNYPVHLLVHGKDVYKRQLNDKAPDRVRRALISDLEKADFPVKNIVPFIETVHDRSVVETFRGCTRGCRFCQAGMIYRPVRERKKETIERIAEEQLANTGHDELSLLSLSTSDYSRFEDLATELMEMCAAQNVALSLPSLRLDSFSFKVLDEIQGYRKSGLTFAPEAGSQRLRNLSLIHISARKCLLKQMDRADRPGRLLQYALGSF